MVDVSETRATLRISLKVSTDTILAARAAQLPFCKTLRLIESADIISTVEFDHTGNYLATGDKGGRVVLFERNETVSLASSPSWLCGS